MAQIQVQFKNHTFEREMKNSDLYSKTKRLSTSQVYPGEGVCSSVCLSASVCLSLFLCVACYPSIQRLSSPYPASVSQ